MASFLLTILFAIAGIANSDLAREDFLSEQVPQKTVIIKTEDNKNCQLTLNMSMTEVKLLLERAGILFKDNLDHTFSTSENNYVLQFTSPWEDGERLREIYVETDRISTDGGLKVGDAKSKMEEIYGAPDNWGTMGEAFYDEIEWCEYYVKGYVLRCFMTIDADVISGWKVSIDIPDRRLEIMSSSGLISYIDLQMPLWEAERRIASAAITPIKQKAISTARGIIELDGFEIYYGTYENIPDEYIESLYPEPDISEQFRVYQYTVKKANYPTERGVCVGDTIDYLLQIYGEPEEIKENKGKTEYYYLLPYYPKYRFDDNLIFTVENGIITQWSASAADRVLVYNISN